MDLETRINFVDYFPDEMNDLIFRNSSPKTFNCRGISNSWKQIADGDDIWKSKFQEQESWDYNRDSETGSWYELFKERYLLDLNWKILHTIN